MSDHDIAVQVPVPGPDGPARRSVLAVALTCGPAWDAHLAVIRHRSYLLAIERGHIRTGP